MIFSVLNNNLLYLYNFEGSAVDWRSQSQMTFFQKQLTMRELENLKWRYELTVLQKNMFLYFQLSPSSMVSVDLSYASTTAKSNSLAYQPMEFVSSDGRVKLWLQVLSICIFLEIFCFQPLEKQKKKNSEKSKKRERCIDDAPIPPKQLQSSTKLNIENRTKFSTNLSIGDHVIDLSGILNGSMKKKNLAKLVINGQSYSIWEVAVLLKLNILMSEMWLIESFLNEWFGWLCLRLIFCYSADCIF